MHCTVLTPDSSENGTISSLSPDCAQLSQPIKTDRERYTVTTEVGQLPAGPAAR